MISELGRVISSPSAGADLGGEGAQLGHRAFLLADAHVFADAQGARVHQDQAARRLADQAGAAQRDHQADQHRHALEGFAVGAGQVGVGHGEANSQTPR